MSLPQFRSSGDLTADRRYDYALALLKDGEAAPAADLIEQALELAPNWAVGWFTLGTAREAAGDKTGAIAALTRALALDPPDSLGSRLHLARLGAAETPRETAIAYVRDLFDDYATRFDAALVDGLQYRAPQLIAASLRDGAGARAFARCLDLGCGTGLMAAELEGVGAIDGVDLSAGMIAEARTKQLYANLEVGEVVEAMRQRREATYDLVTAADVFCYFGELAAAFAAVARILEPGGIFAFSVERIVHEDKAADFELAESLRFRHNHDYVARVLSDTGLTLKLCETVTLRFDRGLPVQGLVVVAEKASRKQS